MGVLRSEIFTYELSGDSITIQEGMGVKQVSIYNSTAIAGTAVGDKKLGALSPAPITIGEKDTFTVKAVDASVIVGLTIDAPVGCTLKIVAQ